jgi:hypothetical protein
MSPTPRNTAEKEDMLSYWLARSLRSTTRGSIKLHISDKPALKIEAIDNKDENKKINIYLLEPELFSFDIKPEDSVEENPSFFHKLKNAFNDNLKNAFDLTKIITDKDEMMLVIFKKVRSLFDHQRSNAFDFKKRRRSDYNRKGSQTYTFKIINKK